QGSQRFLWEGIAGPNLPEGADGTGGFSPGPGPGRPAGSVSWINPARSAGPFRLPGSSGVPPSGGRTSAQTQITFFGDEQWPKQPQQSKPPRTTPKPKTKETANPKATIQNQREKPTKGTNTNLICRPPRCRLTTLWMARAECRGPTSPFRERFNRATRRL